MHYIIQDDVRPFKELQRTEFAKVSICWISTAIWQLFLEFGETDRLPFPDFLIILFVTATTAILILLTISGTLLELYLLSLCML